MNAENPIVATSAAEDEAAEISTQRLNGVVDVSKPSRVVGWAIDRADARAAVDVEIYREGRLVTTVRAERHREDLVRNGIGTGNYGFSVDLEPPVEAGMAFSITAIAKAPDGTSGRLRPIGKAGASSDPDRRVLERVFEEVCLLRSDVMQMRQAAGATRPHDAESLREFIDRIEVVQARLEAFPRPQFTSPPPDSNRDLKAMALAALVVAIGALGFGVYSMWFS
jgi:hypothetical protein